MAYNPSRLGQDNGAGDAKALFLKLYAGEVLTAFSSASITEGKHFVKTISEGKSTSFPTVGTFEAHYMAVGDELTGNGTKHGEKVVTTDDLLVSDAFIADIDEAMNHYEVRSVYSDGQGRALAKAFDRSVMQELIKGARASGNLTGLPGGTEIINDKFKIDATSGAADVQEKASELAAGLFAAAEALSDNEVPEDWICFLRPSEYYALVQNTNVINRDWGGAGIYSDGKVWRVAGIQIFKTPFVPKLDGTYQTYDPAGGTAYVTNPEYNAFHGVDAGKTIGLVYHKAAVGTVKLLDLSMQSEWDIRRQGTWLVARYAVGHGYLRPEACVELKLDTLTNTGATYA